MLQLAGKCTLVTGSVQGLGLAVARRLAAAGSHIVLNGFADERTVTTVQRSLEDTRGVRAMYSNADLRRPSEIERMVAEAHAAFGGIDVLVNNAVVRHAHPIEAYPVDAWDEGLAANLSAAFHTIRLALPGMKAAGWGRIVNMSSIYGLRAAPNRIGYVTTKTALIGLTRAVALETTGFGITCNAVCPGTVETPVHEDAVRAMIAAQGIDRSEAEGRLLAGKNPTGRFVSADGVAALVAFLCGPDAADITGAVLPIDGGWSAQ